MKNEPSKFVGFEILALKGILHGSQKRGQLGIIGQRVRDVFNGIG